MTKTLPKISHPIFEMVLPSTGERIKFRPFTVKEEKILLLAQESGEIEQAILSIKQVINNCLINKSVDDISMFDLEYALIVLRSKSVDNKIAFSIKDPDTNENVSLDLDLNDVKVVSNEKHSKEIKVSDDFVLYMRYPSINEFLNLAKSGFQNKEKNFEIFMSCMDKLVTKEEVYLFKDFSKEEVLSFADDLDSVTLKQISEFFETMPTLRHEIKYTNKNGTEKTFVIEGLKSFFI